MDTRIEKKRLPKPRAMVLIAIGIAVAAGGVSVVSANLGGQAQKIRLESLTTSKVARGRFDETVVVRGTLSAKTTVYLDAIAGGIVDEKMVERGSVVKRGQALLRLSNTNLQLESISRQAQISEQLNMLRNNQLLAEQSSLQLRSDILEHQNQLKHLQNKIEQARPLVEQGLLPRTQLIELEQDFEYYRERNKIAVERQRQEETIRTQQMAQLQESATTLGRSLQESQRVLENLLVRAPIDGYLSELNVEIGESKSPGTRLGQIDVPGSFKVVAGVDEFYLNRVVLGMPAGILLNGRKHPAKITRIDGRVADGKFTVEADFPEGVAGGSMATGQGLDLEIVLGKGSDSTLLVERGAFVNDTGGNWAFVVTDGGGKAVRRPIRLGNRNKDFYEVVSGLDAGEVVVVSSYSAFDKADTLIFR